MDKFLQFQIKDLAGHFQEKITNDPEETIVTVTHAAAAKEPGQAPEAVEE